MYECTVDDNRFRVLVTHLLVDLHSNNHSTRLRISGYTPWRSSHLLESAEEFQAPKPRADFLLDLFNGFQPAPKAKAVLLSYANETFGILQSRFSHDAILHQRNRREQSLGHWTPFELLKQDECEREGHSCRGVRGGCLF